MLDLQGRIVGLNIARAGRIKSYALPAKLVASFVQQGFGKGEGSMSVTPQKAPESLLAQLRGFRRHVVWIKVTEALITATVILLTAWFVVLVAERLVELAAWQRLVLLVVGAAGLRSSFPGFCIVGSGKQDMPRV